MPADRVRILVNGLAGVLLLAGVSDGPHDLLHTGGPILVSVAVLSFAALLAIWVPGVGGLVAWLPTRRRLALAPEPSAPGKVLGEIP